DSSVEGKRFGRNRTRNAMSASGHALVHAGAVRVGNRSEPQQNCAVQRVDGCVPPDLSGWAETAQGSGSVLQWLLDGPLGGGYARGRNGEPARRHEPGSLRFSA